MDKINIPQNIKDTEILEIRRELCTCCMEVHNKYKVLINEDITYKGVQFKIQSEYWYCHKADEYYADEEQLTKNYKTLIAEYNKKEKQGEVEGE